MDLEWNSDLENEKASIVNYTAQLDSGSIDLFDIFINKCKKNNYFIKLLNYLTQRNIIQNQHN